MVLFEGPSVSDNLRVLVDGCCSASSLVASLSQIRGRPGRCSSSIATHKPPLRRTFIHRTFTFNITFLFFAAAAAL
jgi:hypothetical protein